MKVQPAAEAANASPSGPAKSFAEALHARGPRPAGAKAPPSAPTPALAKPGAASGQAGSRPLPAKVLSDKSASTKALPGKPCGTKAAKPKPSPASALGTRTGTQEARAAATLQTRTKVAALAQRGAADSRTRAARQLGASVETERTHARSHGEAAEASASRHVERVEDRLRAGLFAALEKECTPPSGRALPERDTEPSQVAASPDERRNGRPGEVQAAASPQPPAAAQPSAGQRAETVAALVERIDTALKNGQPTMSLDLADRSGAAAIEITRTARGEVSVRIAARPGRRAHLQAATGELEAALASRGLRLKSLEVG